MLSQGSLLSLAKCPHPGSWTPRGGGHSTGFKDLSMDCRQEGDLIFICLSFPYYHGKHLNPFPLFLGSQECLRNITHVPLGGGGASLFLPSACPMLPHQYGL